MVDAFVQNTKNNDPLMPQKTTLISIIIWLVGYDKFNVVASYRENINNDSLLTSCTTMPWLAILHHIELYPGPHDSIK